MTRIAGLVLAGGLSRRMGRDKAFVALAGRPLVGHALARLRPQCSPLVVSANGDAARFAAFGAPVVADAAPGFLGPLAGVLAGLDHLASCGATHAASVAVDTPFVPRDFVARLAAARAAEDADIAVAASGGRTHPVAALWPVGLRDALRAALSRDIRSVGRFVQAFRVATVEWPTTPFDPFFNVNTLEDLEQAGQMAEIANSE